MKGGEMSKGALMSNVPYGVEHRGTSDDGIWYVAIKTYIVPTEKHL